MLNYAIGHQLPGANYSELLCKCGHDDLDKTNNIASFCEKCGAIKIEEYEELTFAKQCYENAIFMMEEEKMYKFKIDIAWVKGNIKTLYSKKKIAFDKDEQLHWTIYFDGYQPKKDMVKIYDHNNEKYIENMQPIIDVMYNCKYKATVVDNFATVRLNEYKSTKFSLYSYNGHCSAANSFINALNKDVINLANYCEKYEQIIKAGINPNKLSGEIDLTKNNPIEQLQVTPYMFKYIRDNNGNYHNQIQILLKELGDQAINYLNTFGKLQDGMQIYNMRKIINLVNKANLSIKKLYKFLYKEAPMQQGLYNPVDTLTLLYDSYDLAVSLELPFDKNPKALKRYHDILAREYDLVKDVKKNEIFAKGMEDYKELELINLPPKEDEEKDSLINKEGDIVTSAIKKNKKKYYSMILPKDAQDLIREGKVMRHCVGGYVDRIIRKETLVMFLRDSENLDEPFATIEVEPNNLRVRQVKTKANGQLKDADAIKALKNWCKKNNASWNGCW